MIRERAGVDGVDSVFLDVPHLVYRDDPMWIPEDGDRVASAFSAANRWFARNDAVTISVAGRARVAGFVGPDIVVHNEPAAFFGYWESVGDFAIDSELFRRLESWARERGAVRMYGPINFTTHFAYRLRLSAERGAMTFPGEPYNPPRYPVRVGELGFSMIQRYVTQIGPTPHERMLACAPALAAITDAGYRVEAITGDRWLSELPRLHALVEDSFAANLAYVPLDYESFAAAYGASVAAALCPKTSVAVYAPDESLAGFLLVYPHYGELVVQRAFGRVPASALRFDEHAPMLGHGSVPPTAIAKTVGVATAHKRRGVMNALAAATISRGDGIYRNWIGALIRDDNPSRRFADGVTAAERWYGLYAKSLDSRALA